MALPLEKCKVLKFPDTLNMPVNTLKFKNEIALHAKDFHIFQTSSPKGNDAHLRAIIQSEKKMETSIFQTLKGQLALWSMVGSGQILNSSKLLCMSSLPVSMKRITLRTTEKKWQNRFSN